jgi:hypothetical protein
MWHMSCLKCFPSWRNFSRIEWTTHIVFRNLSFYGGGQELHVVGAVKKETKQDKEENVPPLIESCLGVAIPPFKKIDQWDD